MVSQTNVTLCGVFGINLKSFLNLVLQIISLTLVLVQLQYLSIMTRQKQFLAMMDASKNKNLK